MQPHPVRLVVADDRRRSRLTVAFRLLLALPHAVWLLCWSLLVPPAGLAAWIATLLAGRTPEPLHRFLAAYVRYATHVGAYLALAANPWPGFLGAPGYPLEVAIDPPSRQRRLVTAFRFPLLVPALLVLVALVGLPLPGGGSDRSGGGARVFFESSGLLATVALLGWFACLATARMPQGLRNAAAYVLRYAAQVGAYSLFLTDRYPSSDPLLPAEAGDLPPHPVRVRVNDDRRRTRLTVLFRGLLALPHLVWLLLWTVAVLLAVVAAWLVALVGGRVPEPLHRFIAAYVRYSIHVSAFLFLAANPFPGFTGATGYPVDVEIDGAAPQGRWWTLFRLPLVLPAAVVSGALGLALIAAAVLGWFAALVTGRMPEGLRNLAAFVLRFSAQVSAFLDLLTDRYPYAGPPAAAPVAPAGPELTEPPDVEPLPLTPA